MIIVDGRRDLFIHLRKLDAGRISSRLRPIFG